MDDVVMSQSLDIRAKAAEVTVSNDTLVRQIKEWETRFTGLAGTMEHYTELAEQYRQDTTKVCMACMTDLCMMWCGKLKNGKLVLLDLLKLWNVTQN